MKTVALLLALTSISLGQSPSFEQEVAPILIQRCVECHNGLDPSGGLDLSRQGSVEKGGDSGPPIRPRMPEESLLLQRVSRGEMPPEKNGKKHPLSSKEMEALEKWIASGAEWPSNRTLDLYDRTTESRGGRDWWAFQPLTSPTIPTEIAANPIDAFVEQRRREAGLEPARVAQPRVLLRRLHFDTIGLPPTADQYDAFAADPSDENYEKHVDALLDSPHFGERWARHWLDVVRFAETNGYERDAVKPNAWRYRDWVVDAINADMPYDQFVIQQLAGDEISERTEASTIATGFLRLGTWDDEPNDPVEYQYDRLEDLVHTTSTAFLGLTVKCARCHDHKFDPIPQTDYYRIAAAFWGGPVAHRNRDWNGGPTKEELGYDVLGWTDLSRSPQPLHLLMKGSVHRPGPVIEPGPLTATGSFAKAFVPPPTESKTALRRKQLAEWIVDARNPLTPRVAVNRIWLHLFGEGLVRTPDNLGFQGQKPTHPELLDWLSRTLIESGWKQKVILKKILMSQTYRQSSIHPHREQYDEKDSGNALLWRAHRRRLDAETLRDSLLATSGRLDRKLGGPSFYAPIHAEALEGLSMKSNAYKASSPEETRRRSIYIFAKRSLAVPLMTVFDGCDSTAPTGKREVTIVAPQALTLMNNEAIHEESLATASQLMAQESDLDRRVTQTWRRILGRSPSRTEQEASLEHVVKMLRNAESLKGESSGTQASAELLAWASLCHVLVNTNEFIFVD